MKAKLLYILIILFNFILCERIEFISSSPFSFRDIILYLDQQDEQLVFGELKLPDVSKADNNKFPLVIGVAGSNGWDEHHFEYLKMYQDMGIATFQLQSFKSRGVTSTVGTQNTVTIATVILDSYRALEKLSKHPKIDIDKVAITGWSLGGGVTLLSGWNPLMEAIKSDYKFAAHLAFYPPCFAEPSIIKFTDSPMHILIGEIDEWTPADACNDLVGLMKINGINNIDLTIYDDAHHSFDRDQEVMIAEDGYIFKDCRFKMNDEGAILMNFLNIPMTNWWLQKIGFAFCAERNPHFGGHPKARKEAFEFSEKFMSKYLLD